MDGSVSRQPQKRGILASATLWWLQWATGAESGAVNTIQSGRSVPGQNAPQRPPTQTQRLAHLNTLRSLPLLCYRFRKPLPPRPPSPGSRQDTAKTRPSHTSRSKELDPLRHRRLCSPSFPFFRARQFCTPPSHPAHCSLLSRSPLPIKQKPGFVKRETQDRPETAYPDEVSFDSLEPFFLHPLFCKYPLSRHLQPATSYRWRFSVVCR